MYWTEFLTIAVAHLVAVASPGPDFAVVLRQCVTYGTKAGIWTSIGVATGILLHVSYCILGVAFLLSQSPSFFNAMKFLAALYLLYLGVQSILESLGSAVTEEVMEDNSSVDPRKAFVLGFLTNGLNPKATLFFLALFAVIIRQDTSTSVQIAYGIYLSIATFIWFAMMSKILGHAAVRMWFIRLGAWFEASPNGISSINAMSISRSRA